MLKIYVYKKVLELVGKIYFLIRNNQELAKDFSLCDQLKRTAVSVVTNIAEGYFRRKRQSLYYLDTASGSCNEMISLLEIVDLVYQINTDNLQEEYKIFGKQINSFSKTFS
ncbi:MAG: four helix bundle protein [Microgenomates group bacterium]